MLWTFMRVGKQGLIMRAALRLYRGATGSCCRPAASWGPAGPGAHGGVLVAAGALVALGCPCEPLETPAGVGGEMVSTTSWRRGAALLQQDLCPGLFNGCSAGNGCCKAQESCRPVPWVCGMLGAPLAHHRARGCC